jgi:hypothetical protein
MVLYPLEKYNLAFYPQDNSITICAQNFIEENFIALLTMIPHDLVRRTHSVSRFRGPATNAVPPQRAAAAIAETTASVSGAVEAEEEGQKKCVSWMK